MDDRSIEWAKEKYQQFNEARKNGDPEKVRTTAVEAQLAIDAVRTDQSAILVGSVEELGEHARRVAADEAWMRAAEKDLREYLDGNADPDSG